MNRYKLFVKVRSFRHKVTLITDFNLKWKLVIIDYLSFDKVFTVMEDSDEEERVNSASRLTRTKAEKERYRRTKATDPEAHKKML